MQIDFDPNLGHEQSGIRPALVLSPKAYNSRAELAVVCPITNQTKGYPFEVAIPAGLPVTGVVLADQIRCVDWVTRQMSFRAKCPPAVVGEVQAKIRVLIF